MAIASSPRIGVIGTGHIGRNHARLLADLAGAQFTAVHDAHAATAAEVARSYGAKPASSLAEFADSVDAATIATPTPSHFEIARYLLERGKHVLVEKPITETTSDARALAALATERGLILQVGHVERFNPVMSALEGKLNRPRFIESHRLSPYPARSVDIGVVLDLMIHDIEIILHLVRSPVRSVDAVGVPVLSRSEDIANARLRFENGCVANMTVSRVSPERLRKLRVFQEDAYLSLDYQAQEGFIYRLAREDEAESSIFKKLLAGSARDRGEPVCRQAGCAGAGGDREGRAAAAGARGLPGMRPPRSTAESLRARSDRRA